MNRRAVERIQKRRLTWTHISGFVPYLLRLASFHICSRLLIFRLRLVSAASSTSMTILIDHHYRRWPLGDLHYYGNSCC
jgi:hypothetical protein